MDDVHELSGAGGHVPLAAGNRHRAPQSAAFARVHHEVAAAGFSYSVAPGSALLHPVCEWTKWLGAISTKPPRSGSQTRRSTEIRGRWVRSTLNEGCSPRDRVDTVPACTTSAECPAML